MNRPIDQLASESSSEIAVAGAIGSKMPVFIERPSSFPPLEAASLQHLRVP